MIYLTKPVVEFIRMNYPSAPEEVQAHDLRFQLFISPESIAERVAEIGTEIAARYPNQLPLFLTVLNGAVLFAADLVRACPLSSEISFVKLSSYKGTRSSGELTEVLGIQEDLTNRLVIVLEDIIDSGFTLSQFLPTLEARNPAKVEVATLLLKPESLAHQLPIHYVGFEIPDQFVIGYGLDYNGLGRNLPGIYQLKD